MDRKYDAFLIFDADNLVHPQFMLEMNDHLEKGESVIQGYLNSKIQRILGLPVHSLLCSGWLTTCGIWQNIESVYLLRWAVQACVFVHRLSRSMDGIARA